MNKERMPLYALALAVLVVGLVAAGVPLATLLWVPLLLACPLMMVFMMGGMNHGGSGHRSDENDSKR